MNIELVEAPADLGLNHQREMWVRVVGPEPLGAGDWPAVEQKIQPGAKKYLTEEFDLSAGEFRADTWEDDDESRNGFEQWWVFPAKEG